MGLLWTLAWVALTVAVLGTQAYTLITRFLWLLVHTYYRKISVYGINNLPREGIACSSSLFLR
jgi:glycerol-3-phosphate O-acyltransferase / dihydroxyacetone phosphate acyltransferase